MSRRLCSVNWSRDTVEGKDEIEKNNYSQILVKPLELNNVGIVYNWCKYQIQRHALTGQQLSFIFVIIVGILCCLSYYLFFVGFTNIFVSIASLVLHLFSIICSFYWLAVYFRKSWTATSVYVLFCACYVGEILGHLLSDVNQEEYINQPIRILAELFAVCIASLSSSLETRSSVFIIWFVSIMRYTACTVLTIIPQLLRPIVAYFCGVVGIIMAKYMETVFQPSPTVCLAQDGKIPAIKRRRSSSTVGYNHGTMNQKQGRRTSLPAMTLKSQASQCCIEKYAFDHKFDS